jgi:type I restriction enzyme, R subunit
MLAHNPLRMDYYRRYQEIVADYNREKDRTTVEQTFAALVELVESLDAEQKRAAEEGLTEEELALFDLLQNGNLSGAARERIKQASKGLLTSLHGLLARMERWTEKEQTRSEIEAFVMDQLFVTLPTPPFSDEEKLQIAHRVYTHVWQESAAGHFGASL